jgi:lipopolysaccharide export LptBFGC system permease protein LptF
LQIGLFSSKILVLMVFTLHRYIFREVFKVFVLATVALTLIMSLGSILRPVQEYGVGPAQVLDLMVYFLPITLTFVLPIAALFATTLIYGRLACDNELDACRASGIPLLPLVYPGLALAVIVAVANLLLSFYVMPAFVERAENSLKNDARQILFRNIQRKGYYLLPPDNIYRIYADNADLADNTLAGVVAVETANTGGIKKIITAQTAKITFNPHDKFNEVRITAHNSNQIDPAEGSCIGFEWLSLSTEFGSLMGDNIKFKKIDEMKKIRANPILFDPVDKLARRTYARFTAELLAQQINETISAKNNQSFRLHNDRLIVEFVAKNCSVRGDNQLLLTGDVVVIEHPLSGLQIPRILRADKAILALEGDELTPTLSLDIRNARWQTEQGIENILTRYIIRGLILPNTVTDRFKTADILKDITPKAISSALLAGPSHDLLKLQKDLNRKIARTFAQIKSETQSRLVFGVGCVTLIMIGIALGIVFKDGHLLTAFAASAIPALALITVIIMGKNIAENPDAQALSGITLMWAGLIVLSVLALFLYRRLLRH